MFRRHYRIVCGGWLIAIVLIGGAYATASEQATLPDPEQAGPYPVGVTTVLFEDHSRPMRWPKGPRPLLTDIWYPATDDTRDIPKQGLLDTYLACVPKPLFAIIESLVDVDLKEFDKKTEFFARREARVREGVFPLIVFSHGSAASRIQSIFWCEHMASHGYVVMAPDHTGNAIITFVDGKPILYDKTAQKEVSAKRRPQDVSFMIDVMDRMNKGADSRFMGRIDMDHIGVAGHSFGGYTSVAAADSEPRVDAIAPMAGLWVERTNYACPVLVLDAAEDRIIHKYLRKQERDYKSMRRYWEESKGPRYYVAFRNGGHFTFTEIFQFVPDFGDGIGTGERVTNGEPLDYAPMDVVYPLINGYTTAFFGRYLKGQQGYDVYLSENHNPEELTYEWSVPAE